MLEHSQKQRDLAPMVDVVNSRVMQQLSKPHGLLRAATECELHHPIEIVVPKAREEIADGDFDLTHRSNNDVAVG